MVRGTGPLAAIVPPELGEIVNQVRPAGLLSTVAIAVYVTPWIPVVDTVTLCCAELLLPPIWNARFTELGVTRTGGAPETVSVTGILRGAPPDEGVIVTAPLYVPADR